MKAFISRERAKTRKNDSEKTRKKGSKLGSNLGVERQKEWLGKRCQKLFRVLQNRQQGRSVCKLKCDWQVKHESNYQLRQSKCKLGMQVKNKDYSGIVRGSVTKKRKCELRVWCVVSNCDAAELGSIPKVR